MRWPLLVLSMIYPGYTTPIKYANAFIFMIIVIPLQSFLYFFFFFLFFFFWLMIIPFAFQKDIFQDIAQRQNADEPIILIDDDKSMNSRFPDRIKNSVEPVINRTSVYSGEVLQSIA